MKHLSREISLYKYIGRELAGHERGLRAVIYLQAFAGICETAESALMKWQSLDSHKKKRVLEAYTSMRYMDAKEQKEVYE